MKYENLKALLYNSSSSRKFFFSLSVLEQMEIHKYNNYIHTLFDLISINENLKNHQKLLSLSNSLFKNYNA